MINSSGKRLVFRLADIGFSLPIENLLEILEVDEGTLDETAADANLGLLGLVAFRDEAIYLRDIYSHLGLTTLARPGLYLVVAGSDGAWALPVDRIEGIFAASEFRLRSLPSLLTSAPLPFANVDLWRGEPLVRFDPAALEQWQGAA